MFCPVERRLSVDDPLLMEELTKQTAEAIALSEADERAVELELVLIKELVKPGSELAAKDAAQNTDRQKEAGRRGDPLGAIAVQAAGTRSISEPISVYSVCFTSGDRTCNITLMSIASFLPGAPPDTNNLILFDLLDTSPTDQAYARSQMLKFLEALPPGLRIALFVLTGHELRMVQDFTGSSSRLTGAARALTPESELLFQSQTAQKHSNDVTGSMPGLATPKGNDDSMIQDLIQDLATENFQHGQERSQFAAEAFRALAKTTAGMSGRKNLFWLAGSRIAMYPISVLGLQASSVNAEMSGNGAPAGPPSLPNGGRIFQTGQQDTANGEFRERAEEIAAQTGGQAFVNMNDLAGALRSALEGGEHYYSLVYSPTDKNLNGRFRKIRVELARKGYTLSYRQGYFASPVDERKPGTQPCPTVVPRVRQCAVRGTASLLKVVRS